MKDLLKQALDALESIPASDSDCDEQTQHEDDAIQESIIALRAAIAHPEPTDALQAFEAYAATFDTFGNKWQDMGADEYFAAGWDAAKTAQPDEPVAWRVRWTATANEPSNINPWVVLSLTEYKSNPSRDEVPLYLHPSQPYVPLTDEQIDKLFVGIDDRFEFARAVERAVRGEK